MYTKINTPIELKPWTKDMFESAYRANSLVQEAIELVSILWSGGLIKYFSPLHLFSSASRIEIVECENTKDMAKKIRLLKKILPDAKPRPNPISMWSPWGDMVIIQKLYKSETFPNFDIAFWLKTDVDHIPTEFQTEKCKFVETTETKYTLECGL